MNIDYFFSINPHRINLNENKLINDFRYILQKYYRKSLGKNYHKKKDQQFKLYIFPEFGKIRDIEKHTHLHLIINLPINKRKEFYSFITNGLSLIYPRTTYDIKPKEDAYLLSYLTKEDDNPILCNQDLY